MKATYLLLVGSVLSVIPGAADAQLGLTAAEGTTSLISKQQWTVSADLKESAVAVTRAFGTFGLPHERFSNIKLSLAAQKGKRDLFAKGEVVPGIAFEVRQGWSSYRSNPQSSCGGGFRAVYLSGAVEAVNRKIAQQDASGIFVLREETGSSATIGVGTELSPSMCHTFGVQVSSQWNRRVPLTSSTQQVCVTRQTGVDATGRPILVSDCSERYVGQVGDTRGIVARIDYRGPRWPGRADTPKDLVATISLLVAASVTAIDGHLPRYNFAIGPSVFAPNSEKMVGAVLAELSDLTNSSGQAPHLSDQLGVRLYLGIPWGGK